jgi:hypothetical protein
MKIILAGLMLAAALAQATPVTRPVYSGLSPQFGTILHMVTDEDTPEWAKLPNARAWYEIVTGFQLGGSEGILIAFRGVLMLDPEWRVITWSEIIPVGQGEEESETTHNPEPGTLLMMAAGALLLIGVRHRQAKSNPCWRR